MSVANSSTTSTRHRDEKPSTEHRTTTRHEEKRKCTTTTSSSDWKDCDPEGRIRRDEERKRRKYDEKRRSGGGDRYRERTDDDRRRPDDEKRRSSRSRDDGSHQSSRGGSRRDMRRDERSSERKKRSDQVRAKEATPPRDESVDVVEEMLKSFPPKSPAVPGSRHQTSRVKDPLAPVTGTWGDEMDATETTKKDDDKENGAPNPWKKSESTGERLTDETRLTKRQRQIDIGKATEAYSIYCEKVPRNERTKHHPQTPDKGVACSSRSWQGVMRVWRRKLHYWDTPEVTKTYQKKLAHMLPFDDSDEEDEEPEGSEKNEENEVEAVERLVVAERKLTEGCDEIIDTGHSQEAACSSGAGGNQSLHCEDDIITEAMLF